MIVTKHAIRRLKKHNLAPKTMSSLSAKNYIKKQIRNNTKIVKKNQSTGATYRINPAFTAVMYGERVITIYPSSLEGNGDNRAMQEEC